MDLLVYFHYFILSNNYYLLDNSKDFNIIAKNTSYLTLQYMLYDLYIEYNNIHFVIHHLLCFYGIFYILYYEIYHVLFLYLLLGEISNLSIDLVNLQILKNNNIIAITFLFRIIPIPILTYKNYDNTPIFLCLLTDNFLHLYWIINRKNVK